MFASSCCLRNTNPLSNLCITLNSTLNQNTSTSAITLCVNAFKIAISISHTVHLKTTEPTHWQRHFPSPYTWNRLPLLTCIPIEGECCGDMSGPVNWCTRAGLSLRATTCLILFLSPASNYLLRIHTPVSTHPLNYIIAFLFSSYRYLSKYLYKPCP